MTYSVNRLTNVITIPKADLVLVSGTLYELDTEIFRNALHIIQSSEEGIVFLDMFTRNAPYTVAGVTYAQSIEVINGYSITFEDGFYSVRLIGSNNNIFDIENNILNQNTVQVIPTNSAGLIDVNKLDIEAGAYNSQIYMDQVSGIDGVGHPFGTERQPVLTQTVAITRAIDRNLTKIKIIGSATLTNVVSLDSYQFIGDNRSSTILTFINADTGDVVLEKLNFSGSMNGGIDANRCTIGAITGIGDTVNETIINDSLFQGNVILRADNTQQVTIVNCGSIANNIMVLDVNGSSGDITIQNYTDRIRIINMTTAINIHVSSGAGCELTIDASCTSVTLFEVHGNVNIINESDLTIDDDTTEHKIKYLERSVWVDTEQIVVGSGTQAIPFNDLTKAIDFAEIEGIKTLKIYADIVIDRQLKNFKIIGVGSPTIDCNNQNLNKSEFENVKMEGVYVGIIKVTNSDLLNGFNLNGEFTDNILKGDLFCVDGADIFMSRNDSGIPGLDRPTISMNATGTCQLNIRKNGGGLTIKDCNQPTDVVTVEVSEGALTFDVSNTDGVMVARGVNEFIDVSNGSMVFDQTIRPSDIKNINLKTDELHRVRGLELGVPSVNKPDSIVAGDVSLTLTGDGETITTVTRNP